MIKMDTKQEILRRYFREHDSERKISRDLQISRITVKRYLRDYLKKSEQAVQDNQQDLIQDYSCSGPSYNTTHRSKRKLTQEIGNIIGDLLQDNDRKKQEGLRKQIMRKVDIHEYILAQGHQIGYTTVCNFIRAQEITRREAFIRQMYQPGEECEFDWAEVKIRIDGILKRMYLAVFASSYGNYRFGKLYSRQDTLAFMESHNDFFAHIGGVYREMVYDNMRVAVSEFVGRHEKNPTKALTNLSGWYQFRWRFCNVYRGNEKGHVERSVEFIRRKAFSGKDEFASLAQAQDHLMEVVERINRTTNSQSDRSASQLLDEERTLLWKYPGPMECYQTTSLKVDKYSTFSYGTNRYSVPDHLVGKIVDVKLYSNRLKVYYNLQELCLWQRSYETHLWYINIDHYLRTLSRKPGALHGSVALEQSPPEIKALYHQFFKNHPRDFVDILLYCKSNDIAHQKLTETANLVNELCPADVSSDKIMALLGNQTAVQERLVSTCTEKNEIQEHSFEQLREVALLFEGGTK